MRGLALALGLAATLGGCGSALQRNVQTAHVTRAALSVTAVGLHARCIPEVVLALPEAAQETRAERCLILDSGYKTARASWILWIEALIVAGDSPEALHAALRLARPILDFYRDLGGALRDLGVPVPDLPGLLSGAAQEGE